MDNLPRRDNLQEAGVWEKLANYSPDLLCTVDRNGGFVHVSDACTHILGYAAEELVGHHFSEFLYPAYYQDSMDVAHSLKSGSITHSFENYYIHKDGHRVLLQWSGRWSPEEEVFYCIARDVTQQGLAQERLLGIEELHQAFIKHGDDIMALLDEAGNYLYVSESVSKVLGYTPDQLLGKSGVSLIHANDLPQAQSAMAALLEGKEQVSILELRFKTAQGHWRWIESTITNQLEHPRIKALVVNARDITGRVESSIQLQESEQRFRSLFQNNPDIMIIENQYGEILDVNRAGETFTRLSKKELLQCAFTDFLPPEPAAVFREQTQAVLQGETVKLELEAVYGSHTKKVFDITRIPVQLNGRILAVHTIVKDITAVTHYYNTVKEQTQKLNNIFESITDAFYTLDRNWNFTYLNREVDRLLLTDREMLLGRNAWDIFPEEVNGEIYRNFHEAAATGRPVHFEAYFARLNKWYNIKAFPSADGLSVYFDDVTERVLAQQEIKKLSLVASTTASGVVIQDPEYRIEWVNAGFSRMTGYALAEAAGKRPIELLHHDQTDYKVLEQVRQQMVWAEGATFEILTRKKNGEDLWLSVQMNTLQDEWKQVAGFATTLTDITALKKSEMERARVAEDLSRQNQDLQQFTFIVSHNLRSPVAKAQGLIDLILHERQGSELYDQCLANLQVSVDQLDMILQDLNKVLTIRDNRDAVEKEKVDLPIMCQQAIYSLQESISACGGEVDMDFGECRYIWGNPAYLYSILVNLLSNAIKYRSADRPLKVQISCQRTQESGMILSFSDNGRGIDLEKAGQHVFKLYRRFHAGVEGRGMGLFLVKTHVEAMGGRITVESQVGVGTRFFIYL
jgi:PAS domain S-box-containing protein